jgi:GNAT superfamily N-acetyltransferase
MSRTRILVADTDARIAACYPVLSQLRPQLAERNFVARIRELAASTGFRLACLEDGGIRAVAGYRIADWLHGGKYLEIEDLVTADGERSRGFGGQLFDWLVAEARRESCRQVRLLSGVRRVDAHRFYQRKGMRIEAHYFSLDLGGTG